MNNITNFLAQRIDNQENLHLMVAGHMLDDKHPDRSSVTDRISRVVSDGKEVLNGDKFVLFKWKTEYTIKIIPEEKDSEGRLAPILCHFDIKKVKGRKTRTVEAIVHDIKGFLKKIKRAINDQTEREIKEALNKEIVREHPLKKPCKFLQGMKTRFTPRANIPIYNNITKERLIEKLGYEIWLLDYLSKTQNLFQGGTDMSTIRLNSRDKAVTVDVKIQEHFGSGHAIQIIDSMAPLVFTSSYKVLDMIFKDLLQIVWAN